MRKSRMPKIGDLIIQNDKYYGLVRDIEIDKWGHQRCVRIEWSAHTIGSHRSLAHEVYAGHGEILAHEAYAEHDDILAHDEFAEHGLGLRDLLNRVRLTNVVHLKTKKRV